MAQAEQMLWAPLGLARQNENERGISPRGAAALVDNGAGTPPERIEYTHERK